MWECACVELDVLDVIAGSVDQENDERPGEGELDHCLAHALTRPRVRVLDRTAEPPGMGWRPSAASLGSAGSWHTRFAVVPCGELQRLDNIQRPAHSPTTHTSRDLDQR